MQAKIQVGIMYAPTLNVALEGIYTDTESGREYTGEVLIEKIAEHEILFTIQDESFRKTLPFQLDPVDHSQSIFELKNVTIGIDFHWERKENQRFRGSLMIIEENNQLTAINELPLEEYLKSVISSEMSATSSEELLKAHAVVSRSWLLAQINQGNKVRGGTSHSSGYDSETEHIRWYDREDHANFHVCADDHCQRYQGITKSTTQAVNKAIDETFGMVLAYEGEICDARYSKSCGGITEVFENVWQPINHPYLARLIDNDKEPDGFDTMLDTEEKAHRWITHSPEAFCNTHDKEILSQVLNDYDQETQDFYRWKKEYSQDELRHLMKNRIGLDVGHIVELIPLERGESGRLIKLMIRGTLKTITIGKELEIRKAFSNSHLYSSAFVIDAQNPIDGIPQKFIFTGAGWGHGVGLCQIGAAVMGARGYTYEQILKHYFIGAQLEKRY